MNKVILVGRATRDAEVSYGGANKDVAVARVSLAVDRRYKKEGDEQTADFINLVAFGKAAEGFEKYIRKGVKIGISGRIQTGSYTNKDGQKVYTTDVVVEEWEFCESKKNSENAPAGSAPTDSDGFMKVADSIDEELPFA